MDVRSDVWSVAIVLFEMLTGKAYFQSEASSKLEWMIRNYKALQPAIAGIQPGLREILTRALDPDSDKRFPSAAAFQSALHEWRRFAVASPEPKTEDLDATRRTAYANPDERTRRTTTPLQAATATAAPIPARTSVLPARMPKNAARATVALSVSLFFLFLFTLVYETRMWGNAGALARRIESGQESLDDGAREYKALSAKSWFSLPLYPARASLRERYAAEADRVLADYREASESTPVYMRDWLRAKAALKAALDFAPDDKNLQGKSKLVQGFIDLLNRDPKTRQADPRLRTARADFEEARGLLPHSPDPHLGLAQIFMRDGELEQAENELNEAQRNGFRPGRREQRDLADTYRRRGERFLAAAAKTHDMGQMQDALEKGVSDLTHAQALYNTIAPFFNGVALAEEVLNERGKAEKTLEASKMASANSDPPKENP
jgi:hypothetical protein